MDEPLKEDWSELKCLLPLLRTRYDDALDERGTYVDACGEGLYLVKLDNSALCIAGVMENISGNWKVACSGGHVLFMTDSSDDYDVPFELEKFRSAYRYIADLVYPALWLSPTAAVMDQTVHDD